VTSVHRRSAPSVGPGPPSWQRFRHAQLAEARHTNDLLGLGDLTGVIQQPAKGTTF
jgi:hypothetical protein